MSEAAEGREGRRSVMSVVVKPKVSSCWMLVPGKEPWWVYGEVRIPWEGRSWCARDGDREVEVGARC